MHPVLVLAAIPLFIKTAAFAQCQGGSEGKLNQNLKSEIQRAWSQIFTIETNCMVAKLSQVKLSSLYLHGIA